MRFLLPFFASCFFVLCAKAGIVSFSAGPRVFLPGQQVTLSWSVSAGDNISISPGVGVVSGASGSVPVFPAGQTTYTLINATSGTSAQVTVKPMMPAQLQHRWGFNESSGSTVFDAVGGASGNAIIRGAGYSRQGGRVILPGGSSGSAPYIDLPNGLISSRDEVTIEGWATIDGSQSWSRILDFGTGTAGELNGPGGSATGTEYLMLTAQIGSDQSRKQLELKDDGVANLMAGGDPVTLGQEFHFAVVYDADGNEGAPQMRYYRDGALILTLNTGFQLKDIVDVNNWLGRSNWTADRNLHGSFNEVRVWNGALDAVAIADAVASGPDALPSTPRIDAFAVLPEATIYKGSSVRLSYVFSHAGGEVTGSIDQGIGQLSGTSGFVSVTPAQTTTYTLTVNSAGGVRSASVTVNVIPSEPSAENITLRTGYQTPVPVTLVARDLNTPTGSLSFSIVTPPAHGQLSGTGANRTYTPAPGYSGSDFFTYIANDGTGDSNVATVSITVHPPPVAPTNLALSESALFTSYIPGSFAGRLNATDGNPDDRFSFTLVDGEGSTHNSYFVISGNQLIAARNFSGDLGAEISIRLQVTDSAGNSFQKIITMPVRDPGRHVKINEINYNSSRNTLRGEFIELHNPFPSAVDVSGWRFTGGVDYTFPAGATVPAGGYLVVAEDPAIIQALYGITPLGPWNGGLSSNGEEIELRDAATNVVDRVRYGITSPWPVPPNGDGPSLELLHPDLENDFGGNWRASVQAPPNVTYLAAGSGGWRYRKGTSEASFPITAWRQPGFPEDGSWLTGVAPIGLFKQNSNNAIPALPETGVTLGTQLPDMATYSGGSYTAAYRSVFFRKTFNVSGTIPPALLVRVMHNDAAIVWINGQEVARFGFTPAAPNDPPFNTTAVYERGNDPWSDVVLLNAPALLNAGMNTIAIQGFAKLPEPRSDQEDFGAYNIFDFCIDAEVRSVPDLLGTPGAQNSVFTANPPPAIRNVAHTPVMPRSWEEVTVSARVSDPQGVGSVQLSYQVCAPGAFIPAALPLTVDQILANPRQSLPANPAFENPANWTSVPMVDDGSVAGDIAGDGIFTTRIPAQQHRALVRYRITASDLFGASVRIPTTDDPRKNFALYVYDGVPPYVAGGKVFAPEALSSIPVYQWIMRASDFSALLAYNSSEQFPNNISLNVQEARRFENFEGALVFNSQVVDHVELRLRGGNSRYMGAGKRHFRFKFPKGTPLYAADEKGNLYSHPWEEMLFNKLFGNKGYSDWGLTYEVGGKLWNLQGVPIPESHWVHFRVVRGASEAPSATGGDFWGLYQALELPEGKNFLDARDLPRGNFYKMTDWVQNGEMSERYQAEGSVDYGEDYDNIRYNMHQGASQSDMERYIHMPLWYRYNAVQEAIRHYDIFVEPSGRHRMKNLIWYFEPQSGNPLGKLWFMPYDWDASFGPTWNKGWDLVHNALYDHFDITDSPTWTSSKQNRTWMQIEHRNAIRELRDLVWHREANGRGPLDDIIDEAVATLSAFWPADRARWPSTGAQADHPGGPLYKAADMKAFAFTGWSDPINNDPAVGAGGRAAFLDSISDAEDAGQFPVKPTISYAGVNGYPVDGLAFQSSAFSDPQGAVTFGAMQWRIGEITDPSAPAHDPSADRIYEAIPVWESGEILTFQANVTVPGTVLRVGHTYRARVRHRDASGRWSHWSAPLQFTAGASNYIQVLKENLMITEIMYHPAAPTAAEAAAGYLEGDFEYIELRNISSTLSLDLTNVRFTKGIDFDFAGGAITTLAPGARVLVVKKGGAFALRHGTGKPIAGEWDAADNLANGGEQLKLSFGAGAEIHDFVYDDNPPWPEQADAGGYSLVLKYPETKPNLGVATNWRASYLPGGSPGSEDRTSLADWSTANNVTNLSADDDQDGIPNIIEYRLRGNPHSSDRALLPAYSLQPFSVGGIAENYLTLTFRRALGADDVSDMVEWSSDLTTWNQDGARVSSVDHLDGTVTEVWRAPVPAGNTPYFGRLRVTQP